MNKTKKTENKTKTRNFPIKMNAYYSYNSTPFLDQPRFVSPTQHQYIFILHQSQGIYCNDWEEIWQKNVFFCLHLCHLQNVLSCLERRSTVNFRDPPYICQKVKHIWCSAYINTRIRFAMHAWSVINSHRQMLQSNPDVDWLFFATNSYFTHSRRHKPNHKAQPLQGGSAYGHLQEQKSPGSLRSQKYMKYLLSAETITDFNLWFTSSGDFV